MILPNPGRSRRRPRSDHHVDAVEHGLHPRAQRGFGGPEFVHAPLGDQPTDLGEGPGTTVQSLGAYVVTGVPATATAGLAYTVTVTARDTNGNVITGYTGTADDVVGTASGRAVGNAFQWAYTLQLPVDGKVYEVQFDDWMYLVDERVMLNRATMSKFGIRLGEVTLSFQKHTP